MDDLVSVWKPSLNSTFCSESENDRAVRASSDICVVLHDRLQKEHWHNVQESVELNALLGLPRSHAGRKILER